MTTVEERYYKSIRSACKLSPKTDAQIAAAADIAVHPDYQRKGFADRIMALLMQRILSVAPEGGPYVTLIADERVPAKALYGRWGFVGTEGETVAMERRFGAGMPERVWSDGG